MKLPEIGYINVAQYNKSEHKALTPSAINPGVLVDIVGLFRYSHVSAGKEGFVYPVKIINSDTQVDPKYTWVDVLVLDDDLKPITEDTVVLSNDDGTCINPTKFKAYKHSRPFEKSHFAPYQSDFTGQLALLTREC